MLYRNWSKWFNFNLSYLRIADYEAIVTLLTFPQISWQAINKHPSFFPQNIFSTRITCFGAQDLVTCCIVQKKKKVQGRLSLSLGRNLSPPEYLGSPQLSLSSFYAAMLKVSRKNMQQHSGENPFPCNQCRFSCSYLSRLKYPRLSHSGKKPIDRKKCSLSGQNSCNLNYHMLSHIVPNVSNLCYFILFHFCLTECQIVINID